MAGKCFMNRVNGSLHVFFILKMAYGQLSLIFYPFILFICKV